MLVCLLACLLSLLVAGCGSSGSSKTIKSASDLTGKIVGVQEGTTGDLDITDDKDIKVKSVERFNTGYEAVQALKQGKIDAVIIDDQPAQTFVNQVKGLKILDEPFEEEQYAICFQKGSDLTSQFNTAMEELKNDGTLDKIINAYLDASSKNKTLQSAVYTSPAGTDTSKGTLKMATSADFPPYEYHADDDSILGIDAEVAQAICDKLGYKLEIEDMKFDSIITSVSAGKDDFGMAGMTVTDERKKSVDFSDTYVTAQQAIIVKASSTASGQSLAQQFKTNFIDGSRWKLLLQGLGTTLEITLFAVIIGIVLGFLCAVVRCAHDQTGGLKVLNFICKLYTTVIRGTPTLLQLLIWYFVVFAAVDVNKIFVCVIAFGLNSGAYVCEIVRSGIMSVDAGQMEAGRSLGFSYSKTMWYIILPQAFKNVLPAIGNEVITLLKETSIAGYIAVTDLTKAGDIIRSRTFSAFLPYIAVALIYLAMVLILAKLLGMLERRLRESER